MIAEEYTEIYLDSSLPAKSTYLKRGYVAIEAHKIVAENGEVDGQTVFHYHQKGNTIWAEYFGGEIKQGFLIGTADNNGNLAFTYQYLNESNQLRLGKCNSTPVFLEDGKMEIHEEWQWLNGDKSKGTSVIVEV